MIHVTAVFEDTVILADFRSGGWEVVLTDTYHKKTHTLKLTGEQFAALIALASCGDEWADEPARDKLYNIVTPALAAVDRDIWPIP